MKKLKILLILFAFLPTFIFSQATAQGGLMNNDQNYISPGNGVANIGGTSIPTDKNLYEGVKGSPLIFKNFVKGHIVIKDTANIIEGFTYNFDAYKNDLQIRYPNGQIKIPFSSQIEGFQLIENDIIHNFKKLKIASQNIKKYYEIMYESAKYSFVKLWIRNFIRANPVEHGLYQSGQRYDEFQEGDKLFIKVGQNDYQELGKMSKSSFIDIFPAQKKSIENCWSKLNWGKKITEIEAVELLKTIENM